MVLQSNGLLMLQKMHTSMLQRILHGQETIKRMNPKLAIIWINPTKSINSSWLLPFAVPILIFASIRGRSFITGHSITGHGQRRF
jgi:hypothetical protein